MDRLLLSRNRAIIKLGKIVLPILCQAEIRGKAGEFAVKAVLPLRLCVAVLCLVSATCGNAGAETLRIGVQKTGTFAWQLDVIKRHGLARDNGLDLDIKELASPEAGKLALNGGSVDVAVVDWLWAAREREGRHGNRHLGTGRSGKEFAFRFARRLRPGAPAEGCGIRHP